MCSARAKLVKQEEEASDSVTEMQVFRRREPEHFLLKVESFSESKLEKYESDEFEAGGYKWRLILYPNGDTARNGSNYISLYLSICDTQNLSPGWEVEADFSLFVYNSLSQKYQTYKLADKTCFNWLKTESVFAQLIPLDEFKEASNAYLFADACVFGAEVYVTKSIAKRQTLSMMKDNNADVGADTDANAGANMDANADKDVDIDTNANMFSWKLRNFSTLKCNYMESENFIIKNLSWSLWIYPKGDSSEVKDKFISFYLALVDDETKLKENRTVDAEFKLRIRNQLNSNHVEKQFTNTFRYSLGMSSGFDDFMLLSDVNDKSKGFLKNDTLVVEVEFAKVKIIN